MIGFRSTAVLAVAGAALALSACGESATAIVPSGSVTWYPSTALPSPRVALATPSATVKAAPTAAAVGVGQSSGLGTPAANIAATSQLSFAPTAATVAKGGVIQWKNTGSIAHNVTFDSQSALTSGTLQRGDTWQVQFSVAGTYSYHCTFHPGMNGQVTVTG